MPVKCLLCDKELNKSLICHVRIIHGITPKEYLKKFPSASLHSDEYAEQLKNLAHTIDWTNKKKRGKRKKYDGDTDKQVSDFLKEEYSSNYSDFEEFKKDFFHTEEKKPKKEEHVIKQPYKNSRMNTEIDKVQILTFLDGAFPKHIIENNFSIEKKSPCGNIMEYVILTDIAIPTLKLDFEFPNTYWHNQGDHLYNRFQLLIADDWKIITISSKNPTIADVIEELNKKGITIK